MNTDNMSICSKVCRVCRREQFFLADPVDINKWEGGMLIQYALPYLTPDERELIISGICGKCFDNMFGEY